MMVLLFIFFVIQVALALIHLRARRILRLVFNDYACDFDCIMRLRSIKDVSFELLATCLGLDVGIFMIWLLNPL